MINLPFWFIGISVFALGFAAFLAFKILVKDDGTDRMEEIANAVKKGSDAFLKRQYFVVSIFFVVGFVILLFLSMHKYLSIFVPFAFITGGLFSGFAGYIFGDFFTFFSAVFLNFPLYLLIPLYLLLFQLGPYLTSFTNSALQILFLAADSC